MGPMHRRLGVVGFVLGGLLGWGPPASAQCELVRLIGDRRGMEDDFGRVVAIWGNVAVVGNPTGNDLRGDAYVFRHDGKAWVREDRLTASDGDPQDWFGKSVSAVGDTIVVGATRNEIEEGRRTGSVYVFRRIALAWVEEAILTPSDGTGGGEFRNIGGHRRRATDASRRRGP